MLIPVPERVAVVACNTCRVDAGGHEEGSGRPGGARLVDALRKVQSEPRYGSIAVEEMPCLFACGSACTVYLRAPGKIGYVLGRFAPDLGSARAILDYAVHYAASEAGEVAYRDWPAGVKGHFLTRMPPAGSLVA